MLTAERKRMILERLRRDGKVLASELSKEFETSEDTIRRDLRDLAAAGMLQRVHGGALLKPPIAATYAARQKQSPDAKVAIAKAAATLARNGQVIFLDGGTTTLQIAHCLPRDLRATIVTNSAPHAIALAEHPSVDIILIGGKFLKEGLITVGMEMFESFNYINADLCFLGVCSLHREIGITVSDLEESHRKRAMINRAAEVVALAGAEKLETASPFVVAPLKELTYLVTEQAANSRVLKQYEKLGITIVRASDR